MVGKNGAAQRVSRSFRRENGADETRALVVDPLSCRLELTGAGMIASSRAFAEEIDRYYSFGELQRLECHCKVRSPLDSGK